MKRCVAYGDVYIYQQNLLCTQFTVVEYGAFLYTLLTSPAGNSAVHWNFPVSRFPENDCTAYDQNENCHCTRPVMDAHFHTLGLDYQDAQEYQWSLYE